MSGGYFDYAQYRIKEIVEKLDNFFESYKKDREIGGTTDFSASTVKKIKQGMMVLKEANVYANRIDYLLSQDDSEETFKEHLKEDLMELKLNNSRNKTIFIIKKLYINLVTNMYGWRVIGFVETQREADILKKRGGKYIGNGTPIKDGLEVPIIRYKNIKILHEEE